MVEAVETCSSHNFECSTAPINTWVVGHRQAAKVPTLILLSQVMPGVELDSALDRQAGPTARAFRVLADKVQIISSLVG